MRPYAIALAVVLPVVLEADPHRYVLHRVPENLAIVSLAFSPQDQLYLASPAGVYRYDGVRFHRLPIDLPGLRHIAFTSDGVLWVASDAGLQAFHEGRWQEAQSDGVQQLLPAGDRLYGVATGVFEFRMTGGQALRKRLDLLPGQALRPGSRGAAGLDSQSRLWHLNAEGTAIFRDRELIRRLDRVWDGVVPARDGRYWLTSGQRATLWEGAQMVRSWSRRPAAVLRESGPVLSGRSSAWFLGDEEIVGDSRTFRAPPAHVAHPITAAAEDRHGHLWVARHGLGLVEWIADAEWERWPATYFEGEPVTLVARSRKGEMVAATHSHLRRLEPGRWRVFDREANHYHGLLALENGEWLATTANHGVVRIDAGGGAIPLPLPPVNRYLRANSREIMRDSQGQVWIANKENLLSVRDGRVEVESLPDSAQESDYPNDLEVAADGTLWVGYAGGVAWRDATGRWQRVVTSRPLPPIRSLALHPRGDEIWVAHRQKGGFSRVKRADGGEWQVTRFAEGYEPQGTHFIKRDSRGWLWRGTQQGVFVSDGIHLAPHEWLHLHMGNGLAGDATDQYGFWEDRDGSIWIAGADGVTHLRPRDTWFRDRPPFPLNTSREGDRISLEALWGNPFRDIRFLYRVPPEGGWTPVREARIDVSALGAPAAVELTWNTIEPAVTQRVVLPPSPWWTGLSLGWLAIPVLAGGWVLSRSYRVRKALFLLGAWRRRGERAIEAHMAPGELITPRYRVKRLVAEGGFGAVYQVTDGQGEVLALKLLSAQVTDPQMARNLFAREIAVLQGVRHPGVVEIVDWGITSGGAPYLVMPFLEGPSLRQWLAERRPTIPESRRVIQELGEAVHALHERGIVHRDLKPENVLFDQDRVVLIDLGSAAFRGPQHDLSRTLSIGGSFQYLAPERLSGYYSSGSDVYSLGVIFIEILTGQTLSELGALPAAPEFALRVADILAPRLGLDSARAVATLLRDALRPDPLERPSDLAGWVSAITATLAASGIDRPSNSSQIESRQ